MSDVPLREHIDQRLDALEKYIAEMRASDKEQRDLLRRELEHRLDVLNEFGARMQKLEGTFITRDVFEPFRMSVENAVSAMLSWRANIEGRLYVVGGIPALVSLALGVIALWISRGS